MEKIKNEEPIINVTSVIHKGKRLSEGKDYNVIKEDGKIYIKLLEYENKYYTPELEELCINYQYEFLNENEWERSEIVHEDLITKTSGGESCENWFEEIYKGLRTIRTKYLNEDDVNSMGWVFLREEKGRKVYSNSPMELKISYDTYILEIKNIKKDNTIMFCGKIKSINELKTLSKFLMFSKDE